MTTTTAPDVRTFPVATTAVTAMVPMVWGTTYLVTTTFLPPGYPLFAALLRTLPSGIIAIGLTRVLPRGRWWWRAFVLGVLNLGAFQPLLFVTAERLPGGVAATLGAIQPLVVAGLAVAVLGETPSWRRIGWGCAGVVGVGLVVLGPTAALDPIGILAGLLGSASVALGIVLTKRWGRPKGVGPLTYAGWQLVAGGVVILPLTLALEGVPPHIDRPAIRAYLWLSLVGGLLAYALWFRGIHRLPVTALALLVLISPLTAAILGAMFAHERFTVAQTIGFALALIALVAGQLPDRNKKARPGEPGRASDWGE
ncbi:EamA family transporter [Ammonicoccus fulvus]|uniref:EamA family transporter n=1 Tax=Ammonicoccus fulvus TaxID=3138240 RepID=A0ABZ3FNI3_9ACTN